MKSVKRVFWSMLLLAFLGEPAFASSIEERKIQFGFARVSNVQSEKALLFYLNPREWMFCLYGDFGRSENEIFVGCNQYALTVDFGKGWEDIYSQRNPASHERAFLFYPANNRQESMVAFSASRLSEDLLYAAKARGIESGTVRVKYRIGSRLIPAAGAGFEVGPILESDWVLLQIKDSALFLTGFWEAQGFRGEKSTAEHEDDREYHLDAELPLLP